MVVFILFESEGERVVMLLLVVCPMQAVAEGRPGQAEIRNLERGLGPSVGDGTRHPSLYLLPCKVRTSRKLRLEAEPGLEPDPPT